MTKEFAHYHWHPNMDGVAARVARADDVNVALKSALGFAGSFYEGKAGMNSVGFLVDEYSDPKSPFIYIFRTERGDIMETALQRCDKAELVDIVKKII